MWLSPGDHPAATHKWVTGLKFDLTNPAYPRLHVYYQEGYPDESGNPIALCLDAKSVFLADAPATAETPAVTAYSDAITEVIGGHVADLVGKIEAALQARLS